MSNLDYKPSYRRHLPHIQPPGVTLFVTFRLAGSIPTAMFRALEEERERIERFVAGITDPAEHQRRTDEERRRYFGRFDKLLDSAQSGPPWLQDERIAELVCDSLRHLDTQKYTLNAFCVMPNHVHLLAT